jgi:hypothetical protein
MFHQKMLIVSGIGRPANSGLSVSAGWSIPIASWTTERSVIGISPALGIRFAAKMLRTSL